MDILKKLDKITEHITELESVKEAANDLIKLVDKYNMLNGVLDVDLAFQNLKSLLKGKE